MNKLIENTCRSVKTMFDSYWFYGDLCVLLSNTKNGLYYIANNYLNVYSYGWDTLSLYFDIEFRYRVSHIDLLKDNPFIEHQSISRPNKRITIEMLRKAIDDGWYVLAQIDKSFISDCPEAGITQHEVMLYAYDRERFYFCDNGAHGKYVHNLSCKVDEFMVAFQVIDEMEWSESVFWKEEILLFRPREDDSYQLDAKHVVNSLKTYLGIQKDPIFEDARFRSRYGNMQLFIGQDVYEHLIKFLIDFEKNIANTHMGAISVLCDHKSALIMTAEMLSKQYSVSNQYVDELRGVKRELIRIRMLILKYYINLSDKGLLNNICINIEQLRKREYNILVSFVDEIERRIV